MENKIFISLDVAKELKNLSDEFENLNDRDKLRYFIHDAIVSGGDE